MCYRSGQGWRIRRGAQVSPMAHLCPVYLSASSTRAIWSVLYECRVVMAWLCARYATGTLKDILKDGRRVVCFDKGPLRRYNVHALHRLSSSESEAIQAQMLAITWIGKVTS